jgi:uncharacterized protein DUF2834
MSARRILLAVVLVAFAAFTDYVIYTQGFMAFFDWAVKSPVTIQLSLDLVISLSLVVGWMIGDARRRNRSALPYVLLTLVLGSIGPMLYLLLRPSAAKLA